MSQNGQLSLTETAKAIGKAWTDSSEKDKTPYIKVADLKYKEWLEEL